MRRVGSWLGVIALAFATRGVRGDDAATSQVLFDKAQELVKAGKWEEACPKFEERQRLAPTWNKAVTLEASACAGKTATVEIPALEKSSTAVPVPVPVPTPTPTTDAVDTKPPPPTPMQPDVPEPKDRGGTQRTIAYVVGGVGIVGLGVGFLVRASGKSKYDDAVGRCTLPGPNPCSDADAEDAVAGRDRKTLGWIIAGTGG